MGATARITQTFQKECHRQVSEDGTDHGAAYRARLVAYRKPTASVVRIDKPTNLARARALGYKAKQGVTVARVRIRKGSGSHQRPKGGRDPKRMGVNKLTRRKSIQSMAEGRAARCYPGLEVLNSYWSAEDGKDKYYDVILVDPSHPSIRKDKELKWVAYNTHKGRAHRGLTSAQKKSRGLRKKGKGAEKIRPGQRAKKRTAR